jgi:hypothetical protein
MRRRHIQRGVQEFLPKIFSFSVLALAIASLAVFTPKYGSPFSSVEVNFSDTSASGLSIMPASCPSNPHSQGECSVLPIPDFLNYCGIQSQPAIIRQGDRAKLYWAAPTGPAGTTYTFGSITGIGNVPASGFSEVAPLVTTTYGYSGQINAGILGPWNFTCDDTIKVDTCPMGQIWENNTCVVACTLANSHASTYSCICDTGYARNLGTGLCEPQCSIAATASDDGFGFKLNPGDLQKRITSFSSNFCVDNTSANAYFVPAKTSPEIFSFRTNGGSLSGISIKVQPKVQFITTPGASIWTVPSDWNSANNTIYVIGGGGGAWAWSGGGGGAFTSKSNVTLTPNALINVVIGIGGTPFFSGKDTIFNGTGTTCNGAFPNEICAKGGSVGNSSGFIGGAGGSAAAGVGTITYNGGNGSGTTGAASGCENPGGGGGGAAGVYGDGGTAGEGSGCSGGGGGGGSGGGGGRGAYNAHVGGSGGNGQNANGSVYGTGGLGDISPAQSGSSQYASSGGGGGGGSYDIYGIKWGTAGAGGPGSEWDGADCTAAGLTHCGSGGGGGGGGYGVNNKNGGAGGLYGGGGGGYGGQINAPGVGGSGAQGIIVVVYTPAP